MLHTEVLNLHGITGKGVTIGVLSDSYNISTDSPIRAANDIASGDLPGRRNPFGHTAPIVVLQEGLQLPPPDGPTDFTDEGRGMLQILHDLAPDARLCFASAFNGIASFASNIVALADPIQGCGAQIIVDDVGYGEEPVFSDGAIARAVDLVAAEGVSYFSAASNANQTVYEADFNPVGDGRARAGLPGSNLKLGQVPRELTEGGFHNFADAGPPHIAQPISIVADDVFILQWNDPFNAGAITADYSLLVFDADGNFVQGIGGTDNPFLPDGTDQPIQEVVLAGPTDANPAPPVYQLVVAKSRRDSAPAQRIHYTDFFGNATFLKFHQPFAPSTNGHPAAAGAIGVAAEYWGDTKSIEYFSSLGPTAIYFDGDRRLHKAEVRKKPDVAAVDGVHTTFFPVGGEVDDSGFPSFFGTSAAAPHAAGVGALLLQLAGGPGHLPPPTMRAVLQRSAHVHDRDPGLIVASAETLGLTVTLTGHGWLTLDPNKFNLTFKDQRGHRALKKMVLDLAPAGLLVRSNFALGDLQSLSPADVKLATTTLPSPTLELDFPTGRFTSGKEINFGFRFFEASVRILGRNVDLLASAGFTATFNDGSVVKGTFTTKRTKKYEIDVGFGLIDAEAAAALLSPEFDALSVRSRSEVIEEDAE